MIVNIDLKDKINITLEETRSNFEVYESISLTAGDFTANPGHFNLLPYKLTENLAYKDAYYASIDKVNTTKEIGVMDLFAPPTYFFVPKTKGKENIESMLQDLFNAINTLNKKTLLMTHWMVIKTNFPENEINALIEFIQKNRANIVLDNLLIDIDDQYLNELLICLEKLK